MTNYVKRIKMYIEVEKSDEEKYLLDYDERILDSLPEWMRKGI